MENKRTTIELPYYIGQDVYFMKDNHIVRGTIAQIKILITSENYYTTSKMVVSYYIVANEIEGWFDEQPLFNTPEDLAHKLLEDLN